MDNFRETVAAILQSFSGEGAAEEGDKKRELLRVVKLATEEHHRLALRTNNRQEVLRAICEGASATEALDRLTENLAAQAAEDTAILHASKFTRIIIDPKMEVLLLGVAAMLSGKEPVRSLRVSRGFRSRLQGAVAELGGFPRWTTDGTIEAVARRFPRLTSIDLSDCHKVTDAGMVLLVKGCQGLTDIDLSECCNLT